MSNCGTGGVPRQSRACEEHEDAHKGQQPQGRSSPPLQLKCSQSSEEAKLATGITIITSSQRPPAGQIPPRTHMKQLLLADPVDEEAQTRVYGRFLGSVAHTHTHTHPHTHTPTNTQTNKQINKACKVPLLGSTEQNQHPLINSCY